MSRRIDSTGTQLSHGLEALIKWFLSLPIQDSLRRHSAVVFFTARPPRNRYGPLCPYRLPDCENCGVYRRRLSRPGSSRPSAAFSTDPKTLWFTFASRHAVTFDDNFDRADLTVSKVHALELASRAKCQVQSARVFFY